jgi:hypothetical protein
MSIVPDQPSGDFSWRTLRYGYVGFVFDSNSYSDL